MVYKKQNIFIFRSTFTVLNVPEMNIFLCVQMSWKRYQYPDMQMNFYNPLGKKYWESFSPTTAVGRI